MSTATVNNTGIRIGHFYKVPRGFEMPFAGRWLKAVGHHAGCINFRPASGSLLSLGIRYAYLKAGMFASLSPAVPASITSASSALSGSSAKTASRLR